MLNNENNRLLLLLIEIKFLKIQEVQSVLNNP